MFKIKHYAYYEIVNGELKCKDTLQSTVELAGLTEASLSVELNTAGSLELTVPYGNEFYDIFELYVSEIAVFQDDNEIWRGYVSEVTRDFDGSKTVKAEGILAYLSMSVNIFDKGTYTVNSFLRALINEHNAQVNPGSGDIKGKMPNRSFVLAAVDGFDSGVSFKDATEYDTTWSYIENQLIGEHAGFIKVWREDGVNKISYKKTSGETDTALTQQISFGVNLLDLDVSYNTEDFMTLVYAKGKDSEGKEDIYCDDNPVSSDNAISKYGRIFRFENFENANGSQSIKAAANKKLSDSGIIYRVEANALDLHNAGNDVDAILLGDHHSIFCAHCGLDGNNDFCVEKIDYNLLYWEESSFTFGRTEKIWVIDPEQDPSFLYGQQDYSLTRSNVDSFNKVSTSSQRANITAETALSRANDCMTSSEVADAIATAINAAKAELQTPLETHVVVNGTTMTCDITVKQFVDAVRAGKAIIGIVGSEKHSVHAGYSEVSGLYTCSITVVYDSTTFKGTNMSLTDQLVLTYVP